LGGERDPSLGCRRKKGVLLSLICPLEIRKRKKKLQAAHQLFSFYTLIGEEGRGEKSPNGRCGILGLSETSQNWRREKKLGNVLLIERRKQARLNHRVFPVSPSGGKGEEGGRKIDNCWWPPNEANAEKKRIRAPLTSLTTLLLKHYRPIRG